MNKYQEALNALLSFHVCESTHNRRLLENNPHAASILKELVDRATPKPMRIYEKNNPFEQLGECPVCDATLTDGYRFCPKCGQAIGDSENE